MWSNVLTAENISYDLQTKPKFKNSTLGSNILKSMKKNINKYIYKKQIPHGKIHEVFAFVYIKQIIGVS